MILGSAVTCALAFPLCFAFTPLRTGPTPPWAVWCVVALGVFQFAVPMILWARSLPRIPALFAAFMPTLIAIWAPLWTFLIFSEPFPGALTLTGAVIVHLAVLLAALRRARGKV